MRRRLACLLAALSIAAATAGDPTLLAQTVGPLRVVLLVDSSSTMSSMLIEFRAGLAAFVDTMPESAEVALISTGGQLRIRVPPGSDRERLRKAVATFASDGGANSFLDTLLESDRRFMKPAFGRRQVFVVLTTDEPSRSDPPVEEYNAFMRDFRSRGGRAYGVIVGRNAMGIASEILQNLTRNTGGMTRSVVVPNAVPELMREVGVEVAVGR
jgi:hypothetical protein